MNTGRKFTFGDHKIDIVVHGFPGKSICHGSLCFSTIVLIQYGDRIYLVDVGSFGQRNLLQKYLAERGLDPKDITDVLLTHSYYDHSINWPMFSKAKILIGDKELKCSLKEPWSLTVVPEFHMKELSIWPNLHEIVDGEEIFPGITAYLSPGHTPGRLVFVLDTSEADIVFTGDACKNRAELLSKAANMTYNAELTHSTIETIWSYWKKKPNSILVPGHDLPMILHQNKPKYICEREASIQAWYGEGLDQTKIISMVPEATAIK